MAMIKTQLGYGTDAQQSQLGCAWNEFWPRKVSYRVEIAKLVRTYS